MYLKVTDSRRPELRDLLRGDVGGVEEFRGEGMFVEQVEDGELRLQMVGDFVADIDIGLRIAGAARAPRSRVRSVVKNAVAVERLPQYLTEQP